MAEPEAPKKSALEPPEHIYTPAGVNVQKVEMPDGTEAAYVRFLIAIPMGGGALMPLKYVTMKFADEESVRSLVEGLTGGVRIAKANEILIP